MTENNLKCFVKAFIEIESWRISDTESMYFKGDVFILNELYFYPVCFLEHKHYKSDESARYDDILKRLEWCNDRK